MAFHPALYFLATLHLLIISYPSSGYTATFDLIHRDSPLSPFYNSSSTHYNRLYDAYKRSLERLNQIEHSYVAGEYLMKMFIGTPPKEIIGIVDTGSDITWTQCQPCNYCYYQNIPLFDPRNSSSYQNIRCESSLCSPSSEGLFCEENTSLCEYRILYGDRSSSGGRLALETLNFGTDENSLSIQNFVFGCGFNNTGTFKNVESGIIGLGRAKASLISQLGPSIGRKFSYCLVPSSINSPSKITFGNDAVVSGSGTATTPIQNGPGFHYYLTLSAIGVGTERVVFPDPIEGNSFIDSGTTYTFLPSNIFNALVSALDKVIRLEKVNDPDNFFHACYRRDGDVNLPNMTLQFNGADVVLQPVNIFVSVPNSVCLAIFPSPPNRLAIIGNIAQTNFEIGYDLDASSLTFKGAECANQQL